MVTASRFDWIRGDMQKVSRSGDMRMVMTGNLGLSSVQEDTKNK